MRKVFGPLVAAILIAFVSVPTIAKAGDVTLRCPVPVTTSLSRLMTSAPDAIVYEYRGRDAAIGIRIFNTLPPRGSDDGDRFFIAVRPDFPVSRLIVANHGCIAARRIVEVDAVVLR